MVPKPSSTPAGAVMTAPHAANDDQQVPDLTKWMTWVWFAACVLLGGALAVVTICGLLILGTTR